MRSRDCAITPEPLWEECWISGRPARRIWISSVRIFITRTGGNTPGSAEPMPEDNPLFIPESPIRGAANAMNALLAAADYGATGICCFGAESALDEEGNLLEECRDMALTMRILSAMSPLLIRYRNTGCVHAFAEDEFETSHLPEAAGISCDGKIPAQRRYVYRIYHGHAFGGGKEEASGERKGASGADRAE